MTQPTNKPRYWIFLSDDAAKAGLYDGDRHIADWRGLDRKGYDYAKLFSWSQSALARVAGEFRRN